MVYVAVPARPESRLNGHKQALRTKHNLLSRVGGVYWKSTGNYTRFCLIE